MGTPLKASLIVLVAAIFAAALAVPAAFGGLMEAPAVQRVIEEKATQLLAQRLDAKQFAVYAMVERVVEAPAAGGKKPDEKVKLPFIAIDLDQKMIDGLGTIAAPRATDPDLGEYSFTITLVLDEALDEKVSAAISQVLNERFLIDGAKRKLTTRKTRLVIPPPQVVADPNVEANKKAESERARLDAEAAQARLETERSKLELNRRELEFQRSLAKLESSLKEEKEQRGAAEAAAKREAEERAKGPKPVPPKSILDLLSNLQLLILGILGMIAVLVFGFTMGGAFKKAMGGVGEGIKAAGTGMGEAITKAKESEISAAERQAEQARTEAEAATAHAGGASAVGAPTEASPFWSPGDKDFDAFVALVQEKLEVLNADKSFVLRQAMIDLLERPGGVETAAAIVLSLPAASSRILIDDLPADQVRALKGYLEVPEAVQRAKSQRFDALQSFYGLIAAQEFVDSPLIGLKDLGWLTRMNATELTAFALALPAEDRAPFLACQSPGRISRMLASAPGPAEKEALLGAVARLGSVSADEVKRFVQDGEKRANLAKQAEKTRGAVDHLRYLESIADGLGPEEQKELLRAVAQDPGAYQQLRRRIMPFAVIQGCPATLVREILERRTAPQVAVMLFAAAVELQDYVLKALPDVKAQSARDELKFMAQNAFDQKRFTKASYKLQKEVSTQIRKLVDDGAVDADSMFAAVPEDKGAKAPAAKPMAGAA